RQTRAVAQPAPALLPAVQRACAPGRGRPQAYPANHEILRGARMTDFIASDDRALLEQHGLTSFDALWALKLEAVDEPNTERGGWSSVYRLDLGERAYYLKRQSNHLSRSLLHPLGEPTFAREFRNIQRYATLGVPALQAAFFAQRRVAGERRAILLTHALDDWEDLYSLFQRWHDLSAARRGALIRA